MKKIIHYCMAIVLLGSGIVLHAEPLTQTITTTARMISFGYIVSPDFHYLPGFVDHTGLDQSEGVGFVGTTMREQYYSSNRGWFQKYSQQTWISIHMVYRDQWKKENGVTSEEGGVGVNFDGIRYINIDRSSQDSLGLPIVTFYQAFFGSYHPGFIDNIGDDPVFYATTGAGLYVPVEYSKDLSHDLTFQAHVNLSGLPIIYGSDSLESQWRVGSTLHATTSLQWKNLVMSITGFARFTVPYSGMSKDDWSVYTYPVTATVGYLFK